MTSPKLTTAAMLKVIALRLKNADPSNFDQFVECFDVYTSEVTVAVTEAPQDVILNAQGRAQQCLALLRMFRECHIQRAAPQDPPQ